MRVLILFIAGAGVIAAITITTLRTFIRLIGMKEVIDEGIILTDDGVEYSGFLLTGKKVLAYSEIRSVELLPYFRVALSALIFAYGISANKVPFRPFHKILIVRLKNPRPIEYLFLAPKEPESAFERLKQRVA
jgi:hypothetical protein